MRNERRRGAKIMTRYDPEVTPDPSDWLALDEDERISLVERYHRAARVKLPDATVHALVHVIVENQIAEELPSATDAMARLMKDGLSRHDALHAIGCVVAELLFGTLHAEDKGKAKAAFAGYDAELQRLTAKRWLEEYGD